MVTNRFSFTKASLEALPILGRQYDAIDTKIPGLILRVNPGGTKTFSLYRKIQGKVVRIKIGSFLDLSVEQARKQALILNGQFGEGRNPQQERKEKKKELTFKQLFDEYYQHHSLTFNKQPLQNLEMMKFHVFPVWGNTKINSITPEMVRKKHQEIGENRGKSIANRSLTIVSAAFNFAIKQGYLKTTNPCAGLKKYKMQSRDRFLSREELKLFFEALKEEEPLFQHYFRLALYTGARKTNLLKMKYKDIDFDLCRWRIDASEAKNRDVNIISLSKPAMAILKWRNRQNSRSEIPSEFVFPGEGKGGYLKDPKRSFNRIKERMGVPDIHIHDFRRTLGSYMAISGASLPIIGKALNHKSHVSTAIYARLSQDPVLEAVNVAASIFDKRLK